MARIKYYNSATASWEYADTGAGIDDSKFSSTTTYSSQKIEAELNEIDEALSNKLFAHVGTEEPTDPSIKVWVNPEGEVEASGGSDKWELIIDYRVPDGVNEGPFEFTVDKNGNEFDLSRCCIYIWTKQSTDGNGYNGRQIKACFDKDYKILSYWNFPMMIGYGSGTTEGFNAAYSTYLECVGPTYYGYKTEPQNTSSLGAGAVRLVGLSDYSSSTNLPATPISGENAVINALRMGSLSANFLGGGSTIKMYGVRK